MRYHKLKALYKKLPFTLFLRFAMADIARRILMPRARFFFAQGAEDIHIMDLLEKYNGGFYIDIGSNHPVTYSNTFKLYLQGWNGILVDGNKDLIDQAKKIRKKDICLHRIVSNEKREMTFHLAEDSLMSSLDASHAHGSKNTQPSITMESTTLDEIIDKHVEKGKGIDLLSIDVEGHDFEVLQSIDLSRHQPAMIVIEDLSLRNAPVQQNKYAIYLNGYGYQLAGMDRLNLFFIKTNQQKTG